MGSEATATISCAPPDKAARAVGSDELAQGLMLVRASTMKIVRLQLAMERRDRRLALQTVDDLVVLDSKIRDFLNEIPSSANGIVPMQLELEEQRAWLAREKLTLAAGVRRSTAAAETREWIEPTPATEAEPLSPHFISDIDEEEAPVRRIPLMRLAGILVLAIVVICTGILVGTGAWRDLIALIPLPQGAS